MKATKGKGTAGKRIVLPRSGLAEDVLGLLRDTEGEGQELAGPDRIYAFADLVKERSSQEAAADRADEKPEMWVAFTLAGETFALPTSHVREILRVASIARVPHAPLPVRGITNLRGHVLPVVDLRLRIGLPEARVDERSRILVIESRGRILGLLVDSAQQVLQIKRSAIQKAPPDVMTEQSYYILGLFQGERGITILLDVEHVLVLEGPGEKGGSVERPGLIGP
jgi:purine-binding chemotaxis protein CheW